MSDKTTLEAFFEDSNKTKIALLESKINSLTKAEREGYNKALDDVIEFVNSNNATYSNYTVYTEELIEELKRLRK